MTHLTEHDLHLRTNGSPPVVQLPIQPTPVAPRHDWPERLLVWGCVAIGCLLVLLILFALFLGLRDITIAAVRLLYGGHV